jgi:hypothetical protein
MIASRLIVTLMLLLMPDFVGAQPPPRVPRIGVLSPAPIAAASGPPFDAFREALHDLGYVEGKNMALEFRLADGRLTDCQDSPQTWCASRSTSS